jgi:hypothetical protein
MDRIEEPSSAGGGSVPIQENQEVRIRELERDNDSKQPA